MPLEQSEHAWFLLFMMHQRNVCLLDSGERGRLVHGQLLQLSRIFSCFLELDSLLPFFFLEQLDILIRPVHFVPQSLDVFGIFPLHIHEEFECFVTALQGFLVAAKTFQAARSVQRAEDIVGG